MRALALAAFLLAGSAAAADWRSVGEPTAAVLYDAPSQQATPLFVVSTLYPLEVIVQLDHWAKVRDHTGTTSWVEKRALDERRTVLITAPSAQAYLRPEEAAPIAFVAAQNVVLELIAAEPPGWLHVRHADGSGGYLRPTLAWGD